MVIRDRAAGDLDLGSCVSGHPFSKRISMATQLDSQPRVDGKLIGVVSVIVLLIAGYLSHAFWQAPLNRAVAYLKNEAAESYGAGGVSHDSYTHDDNNHVSHAMDAEHAKHANSTADESPDSIKLTPSAWENLGLITGVLKTSNYSRSVKVPGIVVERPGQSLVQISAPVTSAVTQVHAIQGQPIVPGQLLFELRLTHEDVVSAQTTFLQHLHHQSSAKRELERLQAIGSDVIAGNRIIQQRYVYEEESEQVDGLRQSLIMHGLSSQQVAEIEDTRELLRTITVTAPESMIRNESSRPLYHVQTLSVSPGEVVVSGHRLATLANHGKLYVKGQAFETDASKLFQSAAVGEKLAVNSSSADAPMELEIQRVADQIDSESRTLDFYLTLPNEKMMSDDSSPRFLGWRYRPGQRMEVMIPSGETFENHFVLPTEAVVIEGPNAFVFEQNGDYFDRVEVVVLHRNKDTVVVRRDGRLVGSMIAMNAAFDMHLALKNKAAGPIDPHAGHTH